MKRRITEHLREWKQSDHRLPLLLAGARGVGKSYSTYQFSRSEFDRVVFLDLEADPTSRSLFFDCSSKDELLKNLSLYSGKPFDIRNTLLVLDEIQACPQAVAAFKMLCTSPGPLPYCIALTSYPVTGSDEIGNLLHIGCPTLFMGPLDFEEFCWASNKRSLVSAVFETYDENRPFVLHGDASKLLREYLLVGGLPAAVDAYTQDAQISSVRGAQEAVFLKRTADITRYAPKGEAQKAFELYRSIRAQLSSQNRKFVFTDIRPSARFSLYKNALEWLEACGLVLRCTRVTEGTAPLSEHTQETSFKLYQSDTGLLSWELAVGADLILNPNALDETVYDTLLENFMAVHFAAQDIPLHYWGAASRATVPFVLEAPSPAQSLGSDKPRIVPVELRSGRHARSRSLQSFIKKYHVTRAVRVSPKNFSAQGTVRDVPYYAAPMIGRRLLEA